MPVVAAPAVLALFVFVQPPTPAPTPAPCTAAAHRQFDFWIGEWDVTNLKPPAGRTPPPAKSRITRILDGCAVLEEYETAGGYAGKSLNFHDAKSGKWRQVWIDNGGAPLFLEGALEGRSLVLRDDGKAGAINRITWTPMDGGKVRQHWQTSKDGGKTWETAFDGMYAPRAAR